MKFNLRKLFLIVSFGFFAVVPVFGQEEKKEFQQPVQEVFQSELVYPQEKGEVQLTLTPKFRDNDEEQTTIITTAIEYGITDNFQIGLEFDAFTNLNPVPGKSTQGIGELELNFKYAFMNIAKKNFHIAPFFAISFPTGDINKGLTEGFVEYQPSLLLAKDFPKLNRLNIFSQFAGTFKQRVKEPPSLVFEPEKAIAQKFVTANHKHKNISSHFSSVIASQNRVFSDSNHQSDSDDKEDDPELIINTGILVPFRSITLVSEFNFLDGKAREVYFTPGIVWSLPKNFELSIGVPIGLNKTSDNVRVVFNFIYEFNFFKE